MNDEKKTSNEKQQDAAAKNVVKEDVKEDVKDKIAEKKEEKADKKEVQPEKVETIEDIGITAQDPYPTGGSKKDE
jgi:hypothetical protein